MADAPISEELTALKKRARRRLVGAVALMLLALIALWTVMDNKPPPSLAAQPVAIVSSDPGLVATVKPDAKQATPTIEPVAAKPIDAAPAIPALPPAQPAAPQPTPATVMPPPLVVETPKLPEPRHIDKPVEKPAEKPSEKSAAEKPTTKAESKKAEPSPAKKDPAKILAGMDDEAKPAAHDKSHEATASAAGGKFFLQIGAFADGEKAKSLEGKAHGAGISLQAETVKTAKGDLTRLRAGPFNSRDAAEHAQSKLAAAGVGSSVVGK